MDALITHTLLGIAVVALVGAGLRVAASLGAPGLVRVIAALSLAATAAALSALALGGFGLGSDPVALTLVAVALRMAAGRWAGPPPRLAGEELGEAWEHLPPWARVAVGSGAGALGAMAVWLLGNPALVGDGLHYHVPMVAAWVTGGEPGSLQPISTDAPLEAYPLTTELLATWASGIGRSFVPVTLWNPAMLALFALAAWTGLRVLGLSRAISALTVGAMATLPLLVSQLNTFTTDLPALAWLACCATLCAAALRAPGLLAPAVLAAGLAVGTKTTALPLAVGCLLVTLIAVRGSLRPWRWALAAAVAAAGVAGCLWYFRNLVLHGSPFWPFMETPWGDETTAVFELFGDRLLTEPSSTEGRFDDYGRLLYGGVALLAGGLLAPLVARARRVLAASAATGLSIVIWALAPNTAFPLEPIYDGLQAGAIRYLLPGIVAGAAALAFAASERGRGGRIAVAALAVALLANLVGDARLGFVVEFQPRAAFEVDPELPSAIVPMAGAAVGALAVAGLALLRGRRRFRMPTGAGIRAATVALSTLLAGAALAVAATGYVERSSAQSPTPPGAAWLLDQPGYDDGETPVASQSRIVGTLAGDRLRHRLTLIPPGADCAEVHRLAQEGWLVVSVSELPAGGAAGGGGAGGLAIEARKRELATARCLGDRQPSYRDATTRIYAPSERSLGTPE